MQALLPLQMLDMGQVLQVDICWDHMSKPHQHPSTPVKKIGSNCHQTLH